MGNSLKKRGGGQMKTYIDRNVKLLLLKSNFYETIFNKNVNGEGFVLKEQNRNKENTSRNCNF
jgi:hypothetical protein